MTPQSTTSLRSIYRIGVWNLGAFLVVLGCIGCGSGQPFDYVPVSGRISYEDGSPLPVDGVLRLTFYSDAPPVDDKYFPRPGSAFPDKTGSFSKAMTMRPGDGLVPGTHHVTIGYMGRSTDGVIPQEYTLKNKTPVVVDTSQLPFDIKIPRP